MHVVKIMKHVRQRSEQHASRTFQIAKDPTGFWGMSNEVAIAMFPCFNKREELGAFFTSVDMHHSKEEKPQMFCIGAFGKTATPTQSLTLNMDEAALNHDGCPLVPQGFDKVRITVNGSAFWYYGTFCECMTQTAQRDWAFGDTRFSMHHGKVFSIHHSKYSFALFEKCAVENQILDVRQQGRERWWTIQPIGDDALQRAYAVPTLVC